MSLNILEDHDLRNSAEELFCSVSSTSQILYTILLSFLLLTAGIMFIVKVPVFVEFRGTLRPSSDKKQICSPVTGIINQIYVAESQKVKKNDVIIEIQTYKEEAQLELLKAELLRTNEWVHDCKYLSNHYPISLDSISSSKYKADVVLCTEEQKILQMEIKQSETDLFRFKTLESDSMISKKEMEDIELKHFSLAGKLKSLINSNQMHWQEQLDGLIQKKSSLMADIITLEQYIKDSKIKSPADGTIQGIRTIYKGDYCFSGKKICELIPDTNLISEMYIPSEKIGFIKPGMRTIFKIDAFDYKYWGFLKGRCLSISADYEIIENLPYFRVICQPDTPYQLKYKNKTVSLSPGMTLTSQFILIHRNLWQLIRDRSYDWID